MKNNAAQPSLSALDVINPNLKISSWLSALAASGTIEKAACEDGLRHFGLKRSTAAWLLFLQRFSVLLGVLLFVAGLIFFMAWNWEHLNRFTKFAILEAVFVILGAYSLLRWPKKGSARQGWDARIALLGAALSIGGMLALFGQIYQTGADAWELFRAWTIMLVLLAIPGRATAFWFMAWIVGNIWLGLYIGVSFKLQPHISDLTLTMTLAQFAMLALNECASFVLGRLGIAHDQGRWLSRIIGCTAIAAMGSYAVTFLALTDALDPALSLRSAFYFASLAIVFVVYYKFIPELVFLSLSIFSAAVFLCVKISYIIVESTHVSAGIFLVLGLIILAVVFGSLKIILMLRKSIQARSKREAAEAPTATGAEHSLGLFKGHAARQAELKTWLIARGAASAEAIDAFYAAEEAAKNLESPWYVRLFITIGVWIGSAVSLAAFTFIAIEGLLKDPLPLGVVGIILCGLSVHLGHGKRLAMQAFSQVLGVCGLLYAGCLFDFKVEPTAALLALLFGFFWLLKPPFAARLGAFLAMLISIFVCLDTTFHNSNPELVFYIKTVIYTFGLLWVAHFMVVMGGHAPKWLGPAPGAWLGKRLIFSELLGSSAYACLIFFSVLAIVEPVIAFDSPLFLLDLSLGTSAVFVALSALLAWRYQPLRLAAPLAGLPLIALAYFAPYLALGFGLLLLAFHTGKKAFLATAAAYLGCGVVLYYYNLDISFLNKALVLMGSGAFFLALSVVLARFGAKERLQ